MCQRLEKDRLEIRINTNYDTHRRYMHETFGQKINDKQNTTTTPGAKRRLESNEHWPENENTNLAHVSSLVYHSPASQFSFRPRSLARMAAAF